MAISGDLLKIEGNSVPACKSYDVAYAKVWKDQSTNMAGDMRSTLLGWNVNLSVEFGGDLREDDISDLVNKLTTDYFGVTFYDPRSKTTLTAQYTCSDFDIKLVERLRGRFDTVSVNFIPVSRTTYA